MKRSLRISILTLICTLMLLPIAAWAETYNLDGTDLTIELDESRWYVFTRDNLENNPDLADLEISESAMYDHLCSIDAYMDAIWVNSKGRFVELFILKISLSEDDPVNMSHYSDKELEEAAEEIADEHEALEYSIYENDYKFLKIDSFDEDADYYIYQFITVVNQEAYTLTFQSETPFSNSQREECDRIVDSIYFDVDTSMKEPRAKSSGWSNVLEHGMVGLIVGIASVIIGAATSKKKKAANNQQAATGHSQQGYNDYNQQNSNGYNQPNSNNYYQPNDKS